MLRQATSTAYSVLIGYNTIREWIKLNMSILCRMLESISNRNCETDVLPDPPLQFATHARHRFSLRQIIRIRIVSSTGSSELRCYLHPRFERTPGKKLYGLGFGLGFG